MFTRVIFGSFVGVFVLLAFLIIGLSFGWVELDFLNDYFRHSFVRMLIGLDFIVLFFAVWAGLILYFTRPQKRKVDMVSFWKGGGRIQITR